MSNKVLDASASISSLIGKMDDDFLIFLQTIWFWLFAISYWNTRKNNQLQFSGVFHSTTFGIPKVNIKQNIKNFFIFFNINISIYFSQNICIRQESGYCCVRYNLCADTYSFAVMHGFPAPTTSSASGTMCTGDYVSISGVSGNCEGSNVPLRFCCFTLTKREM